MSDNSTRKQHSQSEGVVLSDEQLDNIAGGASTSPTTEPGNMSEGGVMSAPIRSPLPEASRSSAVSNLQTARPGRFTIKDSCSPRV